MSKNPIMMLEMMATMMSNKEATDRAIKDLLEYQANGYPEDNQPFGAVITMIIKWQQGDKPLDEVLKKALKHGKMVETVAKAVEEHESNNDDNGDEDDDDDFEGSHFKEMTDENGNKIKVRVVPMGKAGEA